jgi:hypothetical protein
MSPIHNAIRKISPPGREATFLARVTQVNRSRHTVDVQPTDDDAAPVQAVRLLPITPAQPSHLVLWPKVDSLIICGWIESSTTDATVLRIGEWTDAEIVLQDSNKQVVFQAVVQADGTLTLNQGQFGGLVKVDDLVTEFNQVVDRVNLLQSAMAAHVHPTDGAVALPATNPVATLPALNPTNAQALANPKVKH